MNIVQPCFLVWILFLSKSPSFNQATHVPHASWAMPALLQPFTSSLIWITYSTSLEFVEGVHLRWWNQQIYRIFNDLQPCQKKQKTWNNTTIRSHFFWISSGVIDWSKRLTKPLSLASHLLCYMPTTAHVAPEVQFAAKLQVAAVLAWHASHTSTFQG